MSRTAVIAAWTLAILSVVAGSTFTRQVFRDRIPHTTDPVAHASAQLGVQASATEAMDSAWAAAPFRTSRVPAPEAYTPARAAEIARAALEASAAEAAARAAEEDAARLEADRPPWTLKGTLLGDPDVAIFSGPSGPEGSPGVIAVGEVVDGFTVREIHPDRVIVTRGEQRWTFTLASPWS